MQFDPLSGVPHPIDDVRELTSRLRCRKAHFFKTLPAEFTRPFLGLSQPVRLPWHDYHNVQKRYLYVPYR
jgi:hypothetical protein